MISFNQRPFFQHISTSRVNSGSGFVFLTGATGMLGTYFLHHLLTKGYRVAVLVRPSHGNSGRKRIDSLLSLWEENEGRELPRPVVIEGDLSEKEWMKERISWFSRNVETIIHSAASLVFYGNENNEPYVTNLKGIQTVLELCEKAKIQKFHHISTAYVAGSKRKFMENECDVGQNFRNDYEKSKIKAEKTVRDFGFNSLTVYRPSIVIGDSQTGYSATFSGIYAALKLVHTLVSRLPLGTTSAQFALRAMGMKGHEMKNLVPVDWVTNVLIHIFSHEEFHGKTYHLTNPKPMKMMELAQTMQEVVEYYSQFLPESELKRYDENWFSINFTGQMKLFRAYLGQDALFDSRNTQEAVPHLPCPRVDSAMLRFLFHRAIESRFGKCWKKLELV
ncbi:MAG: SDR family oxidoreductase [Planctomycetaceae bacterium]|nr:SDR family oxidoreductase [Planctomycetaceae bacterium]